MKITRTELARIVKEETEAYLSELQGEEGDAAAYSDIRAAAGGDPIEIIGSLVHQHGFLNVRESLEQMGFEVDFVTNPLTMYMLTKDGVKYAMLNKKYAEDPDLVVGEIAIGKMS